MIQKFYETRPTTETNKYVEQSIHRTHLYYSEIQPPRSLPHKTYEKRPTTENYTYEKQSIHMNRINYSKKLISSLTTTHHT